MPVVRKRVLVIASSMQMRASGRRPGENPPGPHRAPERSEPPVAVLQTLLSAAPTACPALTLADEADAEEELSPSTAPGGHRSLASGGLATNAAVIDLYRHEAGTSPASVDNE